MLVFLKGWNYVIELYFWIVLAAIFLVSLTILLARPKPPVHEKELFDVEEASGIEKPSQGIDVTEDKIEKIEKDKEQEAEEIEIPPEVMKKQWALSFAIFGLVFIMFGGMVLWSFDLEFTTFLGSCMIYVGLMSLIKGISFQIPEERVLINGTMPILIFLINYFLLDLLLGVIAQGAWMVQSNGRKAGDLILVYILPYLMWKVVPSFSKKKNLEGEEPRHIRRYKSLSNLLPLSLKFVLFTYSLFWLTNNYLFTPSLRQYAKIGFDIGVYIVILNLIIRIIIVFMGRGKNIIESDITSESDTEMNNRAEGQAIRDFAEEKEDVYFSEEFEIDSYSEEKIEERNNKVMKQLERNDK